MKLFPFWRTYLLRLVYFSTCITYSLAQSISRVFFSQSPIFSLDPAISFNAFGSNDALKGRMFAEFGGGT